MIWASFGHKLGFSHIFGHNLDTFESFASKMCLSPYRAPAPLDRSGSTGIIWGRAAGGKDALVEPCEKWDNG